ncbi:MAG: hypothetical protein CVU11_03575 [Bacteroidetes bacterium HGW-Bacteroidetes-6]|jgi:thiol-disulfide isomerase/thioredoxin|nr:MAG: hypothetical protein CVU11_03575 [Bacteroidetes bacterium HGW-Bacteroidetes-6]
MKKTIFIICAFSLSVFAIAQKSMPEGRVIKPVTVSVTEKAVCPDFTVTSTDGVTLNLYTELNAGKVVMIDQFYTTCGYCQAYAPTIDQAYVNHGSGSGNILFWGIDNGDNNAQVIAYKSTYGVSNPCASGTEGGGNAADAALITAIESSQTFLGYPTYSVVCPNKTVSWDVNYPPTATGFDSYFTNCGVSTIAEQSAIINIDRIFPVPATDQINFEITVKKAAQIEFQIFDMLGQMVYANKAEYNNGVFVITIDISSFSTGTYIVKMFDGEVISQVFRFAVEN